MHSHANPYWTTELYGKAILGLTESDVCFSAAKLFFAYGLGNALTFPLAVGATALLMAERPTPEAVFKRWLGGVGGVKPTVFYGAPTGFAGMLASSLLPKREDVSLRLVSSAGEALPAEIGERFKRHFGVDIVDGIGSTEMLHIFISNRPDKVRYGSTGWPVPGYDIELRSEDGRPVQDREPGDLYIQGPSAALMWRSGVYRWSGFCDAQYRLQQLAADSHGPLSRAGALVGLCPVRRGQRHSAERRIRRAGRERSDSAEAHLGKELPDWFGVEIQPLDTGCRRLLRSFPERL